MNCQSNLIPCKLNTNILLMNIGYLSSSSHLVLWSAYLSSPGQTPKSPPPYSAPSVEEAELLLQLGGLPLKMDRGVSLPSPLDSSPMISGPSASTPPTSLPPSPPSPASRPSSRLLPARSPFYTPPHRHPTPLSVSILVICLMFLIGLII